MAVRSALIICICLLLSLSTADAELFRAPRCDSNMKAPLSGMLAQVQTDWMPQLGGWTIRVPWQVLEPTKGTYYFDTLDRAITYASNSDGYRFQGVIIEIATGDDIPSWLKIGNTMAPFWTSTYHTAYRALMSELTARYDGNEVVRGIALSACSQDTLSNPDAMRTHGWTELADVQCYYDATFTHLATWPTTPTVLTLDARSQPAAEDFRHFFGPRMGVIQLKQSLAQPLLSGFFKFVKNMEKGAFIVSLTDGLPSPGSYNTYLSAAINAGATAITMPAHWNTPGPNQMLQAGIDLTRSKLTVLQESCASPPGRSQVPVVATVPSFRFTLSLGYIPNGATPTRSQVLDSITRLTGILGSRFSVTPLIKMGKKLVAVCFIYDTPFGVPSYLVARYIADTSVTGWRLAGLQASTIGVEQYGSGEDSLSGLAIFLIVLASVIYLCVFIVFCYLLFTVVRYCMAKRDEGNTPPGMFGGIRRRLRGWVLFNDETAQTKTQGGDERGFPATDTV